MWSPTLTARPSLSMALATRRWGWDLESGYLRGTDTVTRGRSHSHADAIDATFNFGKREKQTLSQYFSTGLLSPLVTT